MDEAAEEGIDGCEMQPATTWTPNGDIHVLRPAVFERKPGGGRRLRSTYWEAVDEALESASISRSTYEGHMRAAFAAQMLKVEEKLRKRRAEICKEREIDRLAALKDRGAVLAREQRERRLEYERQHPGYHARIAEMDRASLAEHARAQAEGGLPWAREKAVRDVVQWMAQLEL